MTGSTVDPPSLQIDLLIVYYPNTKSNGLILYDIYLETIANFSLSSYECMDDGCMKLVNTVLGKTLHIVDHTAVRSINT